MARREVEFKVALTAEQAADLLEKVAQSLREGKGTFKAGERKIALRPARTVLVEVEAGIAAGRGWLELELEWREADSIGVEPGVEEEEDWEKDDWDEEEDWENEEWYVIDDEEGEDEAEEDEEGEEDEDKGKKGTQK